MDYLSFVYNCYSITYINYIVFESISPTYVNLKFDSTSYVFYSNSYLSSDSTSSYSFVNGTGFILGAESSMLNPYFNSKCSVASPTILIPNEIIIQVSSDTSKQANISLTDMIYQCQGVNMTLLFTFNLGTLFPNYMYVNLTTPAITIIPSKITENDLGIYNLYILAYTKTFVTAKSSFNFQLNLYNELPSLNPAPGNTEIVMNHLVNFTWQVYDSENDIIYFSQLTDEKSNLTKYSDANGYIFLNFLWVPDETTLGTQNFTINLWDSFHPNSSTVYQFSILVNPNSAPYFVADLTPIKILECSQCVTQNPCSTIYQLPAYADDDGDIITLKMKDLAINSGLPSWITISNDQIMVDAILGTGGQVYNISVELSTIVNNTLAINPQVYNYTINITVTVISNSPPVFSTIPDIKLIVPDTYTKNYSNFLTDTDSSNITIQLQYSGSLSLYNYWFSFKNNIIAITNITNDLESNSTLSLNAHDECASNIVYSNNFNLEIRANHPPTLTGTVNQSFTIYRNEPLINVNVSNLAFSDFEENFNIIATSQNQSNIFTSLNYSNGIVSFKVNDYFVGSTQIFVEIVDNNNQIAKTPINVTVLDCEVPRCIKCYDDPGKACLEYNQNILIESQSNCENISHEVAFSVSLFIIIIIELVLILFKSSPIVLNHFIFNIQFFVFVGYVRWCTPYSFTNLVMSLKFIKFDIPFLKFITYGLSEKLSSSQVLSSYFFLFIFILVSIIAYIILLTSKIPFRNKQETTLGILFKSFIYIFEFGFYSLIFMLFVSPMMYAGFNDIQNFSSSPIYMFLISLVIIVGLFAIYIP